jgi:hypothetical protein
MKNEETGQQPVRADWQFFIHPSSFFISPSSLPENVNYAVKSGRAVAAAPPQFVGCGAPHPYHF